ncbi:MULTISPECIES: HU family DNA-binding protein [Parabacteroides]|uniref:HU family DNA-binding protein n=1 Tax=Parabacteroides leei TaxID=2939491 RepID=UPI0018989691|nr:HU family DNA-binding protein [Parabacteroides goldsteinii]
MSVKYKLVLKKDLTKGAAADAKRYYASAPVSGTMNFNSICDVIADRSTASDGDVALVVRGLLRATEEALLRNEVVELDTLGRFRLSLGSSGSLTEKDFQANMIRKPKIIFTPGARLRAMLEKISLERIGKETEPSQGGGSGEDDRPVIE